MMIRRFNRFFPVLGLASVLAIAAFPMAVGGAEAAKSPPKTTSLPVTVAARKQKAAQYAAAGNLRLALDEVSKARERVRDAISTTSRTAGPAPAPNPAYVAAVQNLRKWYANKIKDRTQPGADPALVKEYNSRMVALRQKYAVGPDRTYDAREKAQRRTIARHLLTMADLDDLAAGYHRRLKNADQAQSLRIQALSGRLDAQRILQNRAGANQAAEALLKLNAPDPGVDNRVGRYYQGDGQFAKAAGVWQRSIKLLESGNVRLRSSTGTGMSVANHNRMLGQVYRQLAFCYTKIGRSSESGALIRKAAELEKSSH